VVFCSHSAALTAALVRPSGILDVAGDLTSTPLGRMIAAQRNGASPDPKATARRPLP
jgi:hypothetical protein